MHFVNGHPYKNVSFKKNKNTYNVFMENKDIVENAFENIQL